MIIRVVLLFLTSAVFLLVAGEAKRTTDNKVSKEAEWGRWRAWSPCTRTCGTGISHRTRQCNISPSHKKKVRAQLPGQRRRYRRLMRSNCLGVYKQFRICNIQNCPSGSSDLRQEQCQGFNQKTFAGRRYDWHALAAGVKPPTYIGQEKCTLYCQARGYNFVSKLARKVTDGTLCEAGNQDHVCIAGHCKRVGCDGVVDSELQFDKCGICGGDNTSCHIISGIFTRRKLPFGYNKVATIPKGACNINITEIMPNRNFLALKMTKGGYMINGNWVVGASKDYSAAGTTFRYYRPQPDELTTTGQKEYIIGRGPTNDSIDIMLLKQQENHGIMYEYTIPMDQAASDTVKPAKRARQRGNRTKQTPRKIKAPLPLTHAEVPLPSQSADEGARIAKPVNFKPELTDRYQRYGKKVVNYLLGSKPTPGQRRARPTVPATGSARTGVGPILDVSKPAGRQQPQPTPGHDQNIIDRGHQSQADTYTGGTGDYNTATGHRLRHRGRHGRRHVISAVRRPTPQIPQRQYDYQALGSAQQSAAAYPAGAAAGTYPASAARPVGSYVYPSAAILPDQPLPGVQPASQLHRTYQGAKQGQTPYSSQYPHIIPAQRQQFPNVQGPLPHYRYDRRYYGTQGQGRWALNDQIAVSLPGSQYPLPGSQIGNLDTGSDYTWRISDFTECSKPCGGGTQTTIIVCVKGASQALVTDENCDNALKPETQSVTCNTHLCPPEWVPGEWTSCSTSCGRGTQTRDVSCRQTVSAGDTRTVTDTLCQDRPQPDTVRICNDDNPCVRWKIGEWGKCSAECGRGQRTREVVCVNSEDKPLAENKCDGQKPQHVEICDMGSCAKTWFFSPWSQECSTSCGEGVYVRKLYCSAEERCSAIRKPRAEKTCKNSVPCGGHWFTGPWDKCSVTCGPGAMRREVVCMKKLGRMVPVGEENCLASDKPESERPCDNPACQPQWYLTEWTDCTKSCDTGYQTRELKCLDESQQTSSQCTADRKPDVWRTCNTMPCPTKTPDPSCRDEYKHCRLVLQAGLCNYPYYKNGCCLSCAGGHHGNQRNQGDDHT